PPIPHSVVLRWADEDHRTREVCVVSFDTPAAQGRLRQVYRTPIGAYPVPGRDRRAFDAQPSHSTVGVDVEADVGDSVRVRDLEGRHRIPLQRSPADDLYPFRLVQPLRWNSACLQ